MYKVETHNNSKEYFLKLDINENSLHVTSNTGLSNMIKEVKRLTKEKRWRVVDIENFISTLYDKWSKPLNQLKIKSEIRKIILELKGEYINEEELKELSFLEDNIDALVKDISLISETNIKEIKFNKVSKIKLLLKEIYIRLTITDVFKSISEEILNYSNAQSFYKKLKEYTSGEVKKIYFYNINNLDLRRYLVIELLKTAGYQIIFRIPYFNDLKVINKCWDQVYKDQDIFYLDVKNESRANIESKYISFLEGEKNNPTIYENVETKTYVEVSDFRKAFKYRKVVTFYKDSLSSCLGKEKESFQHGFQTNIGRFLLYLYSVDVKEDDVKLDFITYRELITSGWMEYREWNGIRLSQYLSENEEYFNGVSSINEIINRIEKVKELEEVNDLFEDGVKSRIKNNDQKKLLSNPFRALAYNNCEKYNITANYMYEVTLRLKRFMLKALKETNYLINLKEHFELLMIAFRNTYIIKRNREADEFEKKVIRKIWAILNNPKELGEELYKDEIKEAFNIKLIMSNYKNNKDEDKESIKEEQDFGIDQLESIILRPSKIQEQNGQEVVYLSDLSFKAYDEYISTKYSTSKILDNDDLIDIFNESLLGKHKEVVIKGCELQKKSVQATESYIKFVIGNLFINFKGKKSFSWISSLRDDDTESVLLKQIKAIYDENEDQVINGLDSSDMIKEDEIENKTYYNYDRKELQKGFEKYSEAAYRDLDFCSGKFLYSSILDSYPMYFSNFHQKLIFSGIVSILKNSIEDSYKNMYHFVFPLFPQLKDVVKSNILTCEYGRKNIRQYKFFDGINYPKNTDVLYLLKSRYIVGENWKIKNRYNKGSFKVEEYFKEFLDEYSNNDIYNAGLHCSMCPHVYICRKGEFLVGTK
ncbi:MAG: hypothetical protein E6441_08630 [Clostridium sp.]|uniref:hypothetical protein n=1 Tax=Clostridium TaxID=1485 RepID=UPI0018998209|nr:MULTISPECIES: hypothetical protein [Clostridium]MDU5209336.1 hypothetical protein [Clostridium sp.]MDU6761520.1 hypothetical protein [Clostridium sp.]